MLRRKIQFSSGPLNARIFYLKFLGSAQSVLFTIEEGYIINGLLEKQNCLA